MAAFFVRRPIVAMVISIVLVLGGLIMMLSLPVARFPEIVPPQIMVSASYVGADAVTIEQSIATPIEQQMNGVDRLTDQLLRVPGVGDVRVFGGSAYSMRIWVNPDRPASLGLTVADLQRAVQRQSTVNPAGPLGAEPVPRGQEMTYTITAKGRLRTPEEFGRIVVRANPDGSFVRLGDLARIELGAESYAQLGRFGGALGGGWQAAAVSDPPRATR
ncbi:MAG: efflux RND transporter permease subunit [Polyangia bacterium]